VIWEKMKVYFNEIENQYFIPERKKFRDTKFVIEEETIAVAREGLSIQLQKNFDEFVIEASWKWIRFEGEGFMFDAPFVVIYTTENADEKIKKIVSLA